MAHTETNAQTRFWGAFFATPEEKLERRKRKELARKEQKEANLQLAKDLRESGYFDQPQDAFFYRHYYF
ncbi:MAG: hypothetical protein AB3N07_06320 [Ruegeria sp.]